MDMNGLIQQIWDNFSFVVICILVVTALAVLAKFSEQYFPERRAVSKARYVSIVGICAAIATVLHVLDFPLLFLMNAILPLYGCVMVQPIVDFIALVVVIVFYRRIQKQQRASAQIS